jgi:uncharacterized phage-associated protein
MKDSSLKGVSVVYNVFDVASYIYNRYMNENGKRIDEMKLHKLLYFAQRESIIQTGKPLFKEEFEAWKYGPVLKEIRNQYKDNKFNTRYVDKKLDPIMNKVFVEYSQILSWSLSMISHGEESWKRARKGIPEGENGNNRIKTQDIYIDANKVKESRGI